MIDREEVELGESDFNPASFNYFDVRQLLTNCSLLPELMHDVLRLFINISNFCSAQFASNVYSAENGDSSLDKQ